MTDVTSPPRRPPSLVPVQLLVLLLLVIRLWVQLFADPDGDEAYYWLWGQNPAFSYLGHPPFHAWLQRGMSAIFGWNIVGLRALTWATLAGTLAIFWSWSRRMKPGDQWRTFWYLTAIYLASPVFYLMTLAAWHDHLMLFLCLASAYFFLRFSESYEAGRVRHRDLYAGALLLGLAVITDYTAAAFGIGVLLYFSLHPPVRPLLRSPHLWLAAGLSLATLAPVVWSSVASGAVFPRIDFTLDAALQRLPSFLLWSLLGLSPLLVVPMVRGLLAFPEPPFAIRLRRLAAPTFIVSSLLTLVLAALAMPVIDAATLSCLLLFPLTLVHIGRRRQFWLHAGFGALAAIALLVNTTQLPVAALFGADDRANASNFGWQQLSTEVRALRLDHPDAFLAATRSASAAQLAFALRDPEVTAIHPQPDLLQSWWSAETHRGENAILLADEHSPVDDAQGSFGRVTLLREIPILRLNRPVLTYRIYLAEDYQP